jgi:acyl-coenzyme A synthetase/AMP-(fatty) acid ligase
MPDSLSHMGPATAPNIAMLFERLASRGDGVLLWTPSGEATAADVLNRASKQKKILREAGAGKGSLCAFAGDYSPETIAIFLALASMCAVAIPFSAGSATEQDALAAEAGVEFWIDPDSGEVRRTSISGAKPHPLLSALANAGHPGLIVFTSGSTGKPKAILHDMDRVASKFQTRRPSWRMVMFLLMDHFGGFNTLMSVLANDGIGICPAERTPHAVCEAIAKGRATLLPTTPTFLGMVISSGVWKQHDLTSVRLVTYGAEPMPPATLARIREVLPQSEFKQTYGLSELGVLRSTSPEQGSLWLKVGGEGFETRVVEGQLHIRSATNMLGYLNAESPIDESGWMDTGDLVEERDGLIRFLGRRSEVINVGGQKVLPTEIEDVLLEAEGVAGAVVKGVAHALLGQAVVAQVALSGQEERELVIDRLKAHCRSRLQKYKVPMRFEIVTMDSIATPRAKKNRNG